MSAYKLMAGSASKRAKLQLRGRARITSDSWRGCDGVVPIGKDVVGQDGQPLHLGGSRFDTLGVVGLHEGSSDTQAGLGLGGTNEF